MSTTDTPTLQTSIDTGAEPTRWPMLVGGEWIPSGSDAWEDVTTPARSGVVLAQVPTGTAEDLDRAVQAAREALPAWRSRHFKERSELLLRCADAIEAEAEALARLTAQDTGNALRTQARPESATLVALFRYFGGVAGEFKGTVLPAGDDQLQYTRREPLGVIALFARQDDPVFI